ncbi:hypothetical protein Hanom_Chr09g00855331 [Helianthus anomalus]
MMLGSGVIISATVLLAGSGRKLGLQPISGDPDAFPMNQTVARIDASRKLFRRPTVVTFAPI